MSVSSVCPPRPGEVPNTMLPPEYRWPTGVTSLDSPPRILSTQTRSCRVAIWASELMPTKYLKSPTPDLYTPISQELGCFEQLECLRHRVAAARAHPRIDCAGVAHHFAHGGVKAEHAVWNAQRLQRVA